MTSQDNQTSRKPTSSGSSPRPPEQSPKCPRCDSPNTKFCYYNNYSLSQPRHFCKTCRRYWTKGGALRNVPIGGGCRKTNKKSKSSSSSRDSSCTSSTDISSAFKFLHGLSPPIDFQFGRLPSSTNNHLASFADGSSPSTSSLLGLNGFNWGIQEVGSSNNNIASSIECLSSINQDLHWKLQQQRLAMIMGGGDHQNQNQKESINASVSSSPVGGGGGVVVGGGGGVVVGGGGLFENLNQTINPQPILFQNLEISKPGANAVSTNHANPTTNAAEWFFENPFNSSNNNNNTSNGNERLNNWNGVQAWSYSGLPQ